MDLDIARVLRSIPEEHQVSELAPLVTPWGEALDHTAPLPDHPRPTMQRMSWASLNGNAWEYAIVTFATQEQAQEAWHNAQAPATFDGPITVPFSPECALSGVQRQVRPNDLLWYRRTVHVQLPSHDGHALLHLDAVDYACALYCNGRKVGEHVGAYTPATYDLTPFLASANGDVTLELCVWDPTEFGTQLRGKQRFDRGDMWYTAQSGIWQDAWLEYVPASYIENLRLRSDADDNKLQVTASIRTVGTGAQPPLSVVVANADNERVATGKAYPVTGVDVVAFTVEVPQAHLWTPDDPYLYQVFVSFGEDSVRSYAAFRSVSVEPDASGTMRLCLNHQPFFVRGLLDQGYWPDGLLTAPSADALAHDIQVAKDAGFNLLRKHIKVESERWYALCDRMGMLVLQDMPSGGGPLSVRLTRDIPTLLRYSWDHYSDTSARHQAKMAAGDPAYRREWVETCRQTVTRLASHPCIVAWVLFNESWGQFDARANTDQVRRWDPSRPILSVSGWYDQGSGDLQGIHNYFRGMHLFPDRFAPRKGKSRRAQLLSEFGGLGWRIEGHCSLDREYGYAQFTSIEEWRAGFDELLKSVDALEGQGLSGFVYTQISDVEEETNGLMTYDRRVNKLQV